MISGKKRQIISPVEMKSPEGFFCYVSISDWLTSIVSPLINLFEFHSLSGQYLHDIQDAGGYKRLQDRDFQIKTSNKSST